MSFCVPARPAKNTSTIGQRAGARSPGFVRCGDVYGSGGFERGVVSNEQISRSWRARRFSSLQPSYIQLALRGNTHLDLVRKIVCLFGHRKRLTCPLASGPMYYILDSYRARTDYSSMQHTYYRQTRPKARYICIYSPIVKLRFNSYYLC